MAEWLLSTFLHSGQVHVLPARGPGAATLTFVVAGAPAPPPVGFAQSVAWSPGVDGSAVGVSATALDAMVFLAAALDGADFALDEADFALDDADFASGADFAFDFGFGFAAMAGLKLAPLPAPALSCAALA